MTKENEIFSGHGSLQKQTLGHTQNMLMMNGPKRNVIYIGTESQIVNIMPFSKKPAMILPQDLE